MAQTDQLPLRPLGAFVRLGLACAAVAAACLAVGCWPTRALAGSAGVIAMLAGMGVALVGALAGLVPPVLALGTGPRDRLNAMLAGMLIRFVLALGLLLAGLLSGRLAQLPLAIWVVTGYLALLGVDTIGLAWLMRPRARTS